jgi:hypothetical protein
MHRDLDIVHRDLDIVHRDPDIVHRDLAENRAMNLSIFGDRCKRIVVWISDGNLLGALGTDRRPGPLKEVATVGFQIHSRPVGIPWRRREGAEL